MSSTESLAAAYEAKAEAQAKLVAAQHSRIITRSSVKESLRAELTRNGEKVTESRLDDLAHVHSDYIEACAEESQATQQAIGAEGAVRVAEAEHAIARVAEAEHAIALAKRKS